MITIKFYKNKNSNLIGFDSIGHSGYARHGRDIICAGVSALVLNAINSIDLLTEDDCSVESNEETGEIIFRLSKEPTEKASLIMESLVLGLTGIQENYGKKYIILNFKEV
ncbi:MAG: ribosomal-processing cysteine protease Prp [Lachnospiraceae bacterium]